MKRRTFAQQLMLGSAALALPQIGSSKNVKRSKKIKAKKLTKGSVIGLIAPASGLSDARIEKAVNNLESLGCSVRIGAHIRDTYGYVAGKDEDRLKDLNAMIEDPQVAAIWAVRGGYGCTRLLPMLDFKKVKRHPKIWIGYSDITALLNAIYHKTGLITFHGPVGASTFDDYNRHYLQALLFEGGKGVKLKNIVPDLEALPSPQTMFEGKAQGELIGGNLTLLAAMCGTEFLPDMKNKLVFMEDVGEKPYRIDRMLTQLRSASKIAEAAGLIMGQFADCAVDADTNSLSLDACLTDRLYPLQLPSMKYCTLGHIKTQYTIPVGALAQMDTATKEIEILESVCV